MKKSLFLAMATAVVCQSAALAQLSGAYTIDGAAPTGGGNYQTFQDAANDLQTMGVSGATLFVVAPGTYAGFTLAAVPGTSATNTVTFNGSGLATISGAAAGAVNAVRLATTTSVANATVGTGPSYITLEGFEITGVPSAAGLACIGATFCTIRSCVVHTCGSGIGLSVSDDCVVEDCEVYATTHLPGTGGNTLYSGGISLYFLSARNLVQRNRIHDCTDNGIFVGSSGPTTATPDNIIINNMIWNCGTHTSATYSSGGMSFRRATNSVVANNSISVPAGSNFPGIFHMTNTTAAPQQLSVFVNNIIQMNNMRAAFQCELAVTTAGTPLSFDNNLYDLAGGGPLGALGTSNTAPTTTYPDLASWQAATGLESVSISGPAGFLNPTDLHITPGSLAFNAGQIVLQVTDDIDLDARVAPPEIGADEVMGMGLFASFSAANTSGPAALTVTFTDSTFSSDPGGVTSWMWDFGDGQSSTMQNPVHVYACPGTFTVTLTVTDASNPSSMLVRNNLVTASQFVFSLATTGGGVGDLTVNPVPTTCGAAMGAVSGWSLPSFIPSTPTGSGPFFGITPGPLTFQFLFTPASVGAIDHFIVSPGLYPDAGPVVFGAGTFAGFAGQTLDAVMVYLNGANNLLYVSQVSSVTF